jgi:anti-sigma regulatory factor (Ser/Thr protein kinase)
LYGLYGKVSVATVELRFSALPAHVRTARLVAAAVARRSGVDEAVLDEVRLAVGEACSRAVHLHRKHCPDRPVTVTLVDDHDMFAVSVADSAPALDDSETSFAELAESADLEQEPVPPGVGLAVIAGLVDDVDISDGLDGGIVVRMRWPTPA